MLTQATTPQPGETWLYVRWGRGRRKGSRLPVLEKIPVEILWGPEILENQAKTGCPSFFVRPRVGGLKRRWVSVKSLRRPLEGETGVRRR